jgi:hypothetical protein
LSHLIGSESTFGRSRATPVPFESRSESSEPVPGVTPSGYVASDLRLVRHLERAIDLGSASASTWASSSANGLEICRCGEASPPGILVSRTTKPTLGRVEPLEHDIARGCAGIGRGHLQRGRLHEREAPAVARGALDDMPGFADRDPNAGNRAGIEDAEDKLECRSAAGCACFGHGRVIGRPDDQRKTADDVARTRAIEL